MLIRIAWEFILLKHLLLLLIKHQPLVFLQFGQLLELRMSKRARQLILTKLVIKGLVVVLNLLHNTLLLEKDVIVHMCEVHHLLLVWINLRIFLLHHLKLLDVCTALLRTTRVLEHLRLDWRSLRKIVPHFARHRSAQK